MESCINSIKCNDLCSLVLYRCIVFIEKPICREAIGVVSHYKILYSIVCVQRGEMSVRVKVDYYGARVLEVCRKRIIFLNFKRRSRPLCVHLSKL